MLCAPILCIENSRQSHFKIGADIKALAAQYFFCCPTKPALSYFNLRS